MELHNLLRLLADGHFHSGSELGRDLGVSRTSVWKALGSLSDLGLTVKSIKGKGYQIVGGLDLLDKDVILSALTEGACSKLDLTLLQSVDSTNKWLMEDDRTSDAIYKACLSELQFSGKGRRGSEWVSPFAKNIYLSVSFDLLGGVGVLNGLSLALGVGVARALRLLGVSGAKLKWPNDVWIDGKKISGVLVELKGEATSGWSVTAGIGLNVGMSEAEGKSIDQSWANLSSFSAAKRNIVASTLLESLVEVIDTFRNQGFAPFLSEWGGYDALKGRSIKCLSGGLEGVACGVDEQGLLKVETADGVMLVSAGDVRVRPI